MSITILEALQKANCNSKNLCVIGMALLPMMQSQLNTAVILLEKGYDLYNDIEPLLEKYSDVENVPKKDEKI